MKTKLIILTILATSAIFVQGSYAGVDDSSDRLSSDQAGIFSPGYINASKQKTDNIINQSSRPKSLMENMTEYIKNRLGNEVKEDAADKPLPELKKKTSAVSETPNKAQSATTNLVNSSDLSVGDINIGSGTNQYRRNGRLISEVIGDTRYVYAGFTNVGESTIRDAISIAKEGEKVIVKGGTYISSGKIIIKDGVSLYGGYGEGGARDLTKTQSIVDYFYAESITKQTDINGFTTVGKTASDGIFVYISKNITISNNTFTRIDGLSMRGIRVKGSSILVKNNNFNTDYGMAVSGLLKNNSNITSVNNNFNGVQWAIQTLSGQVVISNNDYYANIGGSVNGAGSTISIINPNINPNTQKTTNQTTSGAITPIDTKLYKEESKLLYHNRLNDYGLSQEDLMNAKTIKGVNSIENLSSIFKGLLKNKDMISTSNEKGAVDIALVQRIVADTLNKNTSQAPIDTARTSRETGIALLLADIMRDPTEDQKLLLNVAESIMKIEQESQSPELKKASDDLLQMVAAVLIAQAVPDLLKEGDMTNIKSIFSELNTQKNRIMLEYQGSVRPYYNEIVKELSKNMNILQLKNIISGNMVKEELEKLHPIELDKILKKLRNAKDRPSEEEHILQQEERYRKQYIDPNKKILEDKMKDMMKDFTQRLSGVLEGAQRSEKK